MQSVTVKSFPRIHLTLIDLAGVTSRKYGGAGFMINHSPTEVEVRRAEDNTIEALQQPPLGERDARELSSLVRRASGVLGGAFGIRLRSVAPQHIGLGSKTSLFLAIISACNVLSGSPLDQSHMQQLSGRGGASGIGINGFFCGGLIVDLGHSRSEVSDFLPSSATTPRGIPPVALTVPFPQAWDIHLFLGRGVCYAGGAERDFFMQNTPVPDDEVLRVLAAVYHGVVPAARDEDLAVLKEALADLRTVGFKRRELNGQTDAVRQLVLLLDSHREVAAGMSSMGPLVYAITSTGNPVPNDLRAEIESAALAQYLGVCRGRNSGHEITWNRPC